jgi:hypothetical protein
MELVQLGEDLHPVPHPAFPNWSLGTRTKW